MDNISIGKSTEPFYVIRNVNNLMVVESLHEPLPALAFFCETDANTSLTAGHTVVHNKDEFDEILKTKWDKGFTVKWEVADNPDEEVAYEGKGNYYGHPDNHIRLRVQSFPCASRMLMKDEIPPCCDLLTYPICKISSTRPSSGRNLDDFDFFYEPIAAVKRDLALTEVFDKYLS
jgi:hypothetical protein